MKNLLMVLNGKNVKIYWTWPEKSSFGFKIHLVADIDTGKEIKISGEDYQVIYDEVVEHLSDTED